LGVWWDRREMKTPSGGGRVWVRYRTGKEGAPHYLKKKGKLLLPNDKGKLRSEGERKKNILSSREWKVFTLLREKGSLGGKVCRVNSEKEGRGAESGHRRERASIRFVAKPGFLLKGGEGPISSGQLQSP